MNDFYQAFPQMRKQEKTIVFFGSNSVGKTTILQQFTKNQFDEDYQSTLGINFYSKDLEQIRLLIWDTCGEELSNDFAPPHLYRTSSCFIIVLSYHSKESLDESLLYINYIKSNISKQNVKQNPYIIALINKKDIKNKQFTLKTALQTLREFCPHILIGEITAKDGIGVKKFFNKLESLLTGGNFNNNKEKAQDDDLFFVNTFKVENESTKRKTKKKCC